MSTPVVFEHRVISRSVENTLRLGRRLGQCLQPGDVVALTGPLGAGKTQLVKGIAEGLGLADARAVTSPTFVLIHEYAGHVPLYHFDAYRLNGPEALEELGCAEYFAGPGVSVVEWADRVWSALPEERVEVELRMRGPCARVILVRARGRRYEQRLTPLAGPKPRKPAP